MSLKTASPLLAPGLLIVIPAGAWLLLAPESAVLAQAANGYPFLLFALALIFAWRFRRSRTFAIALALGGTHLLLRPWSLGEHALAASAAATLLPLLVAGLAAVSDRRLGAPRGLLQPGLVVLSAAGAALLLLVAPDRAAGWLTATLVDARHTAWTGLEQPALAATLLAFAALGGITVRRGRVMEAALGWALLAALVALAFPAASPGRGILMLAGALVLLLGLMEGAYAMAYRDELTGLPGRRALSQALASLRPPYAVAVVDVDRFKQVNDRHGHDVGDQVLRMVASKLGAVDGGGTAYRSGGEEFTLLFPGLTRAEAAPRVQTVRAAIAEEPFVVRSAIRARSGGGAHGRGRGRGGRKRLRVTISAGLAAAGGRDATPESVVGSADRAMYRAKKAGRNRVV